MNSTKIKSNALVHTVIASADGIARFIGCLAMAVSPANTDERIAAMLYELNDNGLLSGGLKDFLLGPILRMGLLPGEIPFHDFYIVLLIDRGE